MRWRKLREAVDFCAINAARGAELFGAPLALPGPTGESNTLSLHGRGVFVCISPWISRWRLYRQITAATCRQRRCGEAGRRSRSSLMR